jgi:hypothetical protein
MNCKAVVRGLVAALAAALVAACSAGGSPGDGAPDNGNGNGNGNGNVGEGCVLEDPVLGICLVPGGGDNGDCVLEDPILGICLVPGGGDNGDCVLEDPLLGICLVPGDDDNGNGEDCALEDPVLGICLVPGDGAGGGEGCLLEDPITGVCIIGGPGTDTPNHVCTQTAAAGSVVSTEVFGPFCALGDMACAVHDPELAIDGDFDTFATMIYSLGLLDLLSEGGVSLTVDLPGSIPAGQVAAFLVNLPGGVLEAGVLETLSVSTELNGTPAESRSFSTVLTVDVLGVVPDSGLVLVGFVNEQPYNRLTLTSSASLLALDLGDDVHVHEACVNAVPAE